MSSQVVLIFRYSSNFYQRFLEDYNKIAILLTLIQKISISTDSLTLTAQIVIEYNKIDISVGDSKLVKKLSKVKKPQRFEKFAKVIDLKKSSFLIFDIRLAFIKMYPNQKLVQNLQQKTLSYH